MDLSSLLELIRKERDESDKLIRSLFNELSREIKKEIDISQTEIRKETREMIQSMLPNEHETDHDTVKMLRRWGRSFLGGLFSNMGRSIFIAIIIGLCILILHPNVNFPIDEVTLTMNQK